MGKQHRKRDARPKKVPAHDSSERIEGRSRRASTPGKSAGQGSGGWLRTHGRDLRFLLIFGALIGVYYAGTTTSFAKADFFPWYLRLTTQASAGLLHAGGYDDLTVEGNVLNSSRDSVAVERGCDAIAPTALFVSAVLASPTSLLSKLPAVLGGMLILMVLNLARIITLFLTRAHWPSAFDIMHVEIWQALFIFLAILLWAFWASWTSARIKTRSDASF